MNKKIFTLALSLVLMFQCTLFLPYRIYASYMIDNAGTEYEIDDLFEYSLLDDSYVIDKYRQINNTNIVKIEIPKRINGKRVVKIGNNAFENAKYLEQVYIPDFITEIGNQAFYQARSLKTLTIPGSVKIVGEMAFYKCISIEKLNVLYGVESLGNAAFGYCIALKTAAIADTAIPMDDQTFTASRGLTIQSNPDAPIRNYDDSKIKKENLPDDSPVAYEYFVDSTGKGTIIQYIGSSKNPIIPDKINQSYINIIGNSAFKNADINSVKLPNNLNAIESEAFIGTNLVEITVPQSVTYLGENFVEDKEGFIIFGDSNVIKNYVSNTKYIINKPI